MNWSPLILTFELALITTLLLLLIGIPIAWWLNRSQWRGVPVVEALITLPLVLPPTVLGFYLLLVFSPASGPGAWLNDVFGIRLAFSFQGLVLASMVYSLPFMIHPIRSGFANVPPQLDQAATSMGKSRLSILTKVLLPNMKPALLTGIVLSFAHTIGEFGVVLMIGGSLPAETRVASIAIYEEVESLQYATAHQYSFILFAVSFVTLLLVFAINRNGHKLPAT